MRGITNLVQFDHFPEENDSIGLVWILYNITVKLTVFRNVWHRLASSRKYIVHIHYLLFHDAKNPAEHKLKVLCPMLKKREAKPGFACTGMLTSFMRKYLKALVRAVGAEVCCSLAPTTTSRALPLWKSSKTTRTSKQIATRFARGSSPLKTRWL